MPKNAHYFYTILSFMGVRCKLLTSKQTPRDRGRTINEFNDKDTFDTEEQVVIRYVQEDSFTAEYEVTIYRKQDVNIASMGGCIRVEELQRAGEIGLKDEDASLVGSLMGATPYGKGPARSRSLADGDRGPGTLREAEKEEAKRRLEREALDNGEEMEID
ncbi:hypothetical protein BDY17DRAFT_329729 [Neohortaea acidophila]|uniref:Uncharacterized protein n=1 Tax=Neohortaea acidophila TaxID=245834 RepID=A0A6A6PIF1_9PEZI|nr:uncharacterized protein BDY17DRAFT_329729 [Neohortaea acidophila]KAF2479810.1 hypothetical protein BDY17DRAFT_329729 [Neohortaea acidophila]